MEKLRLAHPLGIVHTKEGMDHLDLCNRLLPDANLAMQLKTIRCRRLAEVPSFLHLQAVWLHGEVSSSRQFVA